MLLVFKIWRFFIAHISFVIDYKELTNKQTVQDVNKDSPKSGALAAVATFKLPQRDFSHCWHLY